MISWSTRTLEKGIQRWGKWRYATSCWHKYSLVNTCSGPFSVRAEVMARKNISKNNKGWSGSEHQWSQFNSTHRSTYIKHQKYCGMGKHDNSIWSFKPNNWWWNLVLMSDVWYKRRYPYSKDTLHKVASIAFLVQIYQNLCLRLKYKR